MREKLLSKIEYNIERLLKDAIENSDIKILNRWLKVLCTFISKEIKSNNSELVDRLYLIIVDLAENLIAILETDEGEISIIFGPTIFEVLLKIKQIMDEYDKYKLSLTEKPGEKIVLSPEQIESLEKIKSLI